MGSNSGRRSGSSGRSTRRRVVIGAEETVRVRYHKDQPQVESERKRAPRPVARKRAGVGKPAPSKQGKRLSQTKRDDRERRQRAISLRRTAAAVGALVVIVALIWGFVALLNAPVFGIKTVVVTGNRHLSRAEVVRLAQIASTASLPRIDKGAIGGRIAASPWVSKVRVDRDFPSTLRLEVTERQPAAIVDAGGSRMWVVSVDGRWLGVRSADESGVPVIVDLQQVRPLQGKPIVEPVLRNAVAVAAALGPELRAMTRTISAPSIEKTALITDGDVEVFIGEAVDMSRKDRIARAILKREKGRVVYINVRAVDSPTWRGLDAGE